MSLNMYLLWILSGNSEETVLQTLTFPPQLSHSSPALLLELRTCVEVECSSKQACIGSNKVILVGADSKGRELNNNEQHLLINFVFIINKG